MGSRTQASIKLTCFRKDVYEPSDDTFLIVDTIESLYKSTWQSNPPKMCIEVGCGSGFVICSLALMLQQGGHHARLFATDINASAAQATLATLAAHQVQTVDVVLCDLTTAMQPHINGLIDLLLFNPPYVTTPDEEVNTQGSIAAAWAGGYKGRRVIDRFLPLVPHLLSPQGEFLLVTVHDNDPQDIIQLMGELGFKGEIAASRSADEELLHILRFQRR